MEKELYNILNGLMVTVEEDLAGNNTSQATVKEIEEYLTDIKQMWNIYKKECDL